MFTPNVVFHYENERLSTTLDVKVIGGNSVFPKASASTHPHDLIYLNNAKLTKLNPSKIKVGALYKKDSVLQGYTNAKNVQNVVNATTHALAAPSENINSMYKQIAGNRSVDYYNLPDDIGPFDHWDGWVSYGLTSATTAPSGTVGDLNWDGFPTTGKDNKGNNCYILAKSGDSRVSAGQRHCF